MPTSCGAAYVVSTLSTPTLHGNHSVATQGAMMNVLMA